MRPDAARCVAAAGLGVLLLASGCAVKLPRTTLDGYYRNSFVGFPPPDIDAARAGARQDFPYATVDEVWEAIALIAIQQGEIVHASKAQGVLTLNAGFPFAIIIEPGSDFAGAPAGTIVSESGGPMTILVESRDGTASVSVDWLEELFSRQPVSRMPVLFPKPGTKPQQFAMRSAMELQQAADRQLQQHRYKAAERNYAQAFGFWEQWVGAEHPGALLCLRGRVQALHGLGREAEAAVFQGQLDAIVTRRTQEIAKAFFDRLSTQLYARKKWATLLGL